MCLVLWRETQQLISLELLPGQIKVLPTQPFATNTAAGREWTWNMEEVA